VNILYINPAWDGACCSFRQAAAINKYTLHKTRHFVAVKTFYDTIDICPDNYNRDEFVYLIEQADILHFCSATHDYPSTHNWGFDWKDFVGKKVKIFHDYNAFPGHWSERSSARDYWNRKRDIGYDALFSSIPQAARYVYDGGVYIPDLVDELDPWFTPDPGREMGYLRLCHFPTGGGNNKNTQELVTAMLTYPVFNSIVQSVPNKEVLRIKKQSNFGFDAIWRGFHGATTVENLALGIPTMCSIDLEFDEIFNRYFEIEESPFEHVRTVEDIVKTLKKYACDGALLRARCEYVRQFMVTKWSAKNIANNIIKEYEKL